MGATFAVVVVYGTIGIALAVRYGRELRRWWHR